MPLNPPTREDPAARGVSELIGGPFGKHALGPGSRWWTPVRVALGLTVLVCLFGYLQKSTCLTHPYTNDYQYTRLCYTDTYVLYTAEGLNQRTDSSGAVTGPTSVPYRDHPVEYPPIIGGLMWTAAEVTSLVHGGGADPTGSRATTFFNVTALGLATLALISTFTVAQLAGRARAWDAAMVAASPVLFMHAFTNWDLAAVALTGLGLWAWSRGSPTWAGVALGLGIATKLYPLLVLIALLMLCVRARQWRAGWKSVGGAVAGLVVAYAPAIALSSKFPFPAGCAASHPLPGWRFFFSFSQIRGADWGSVWLVLQHVFPGAGWLRAPSQCGAAPYDLNIVSAIAVLFVVAAVAVLVAVAPWRPRVGQIAFLLVAGFVMLNKIDSPQYALWLVPLAVLARPRWASLLFWQVTEVILGAVNLYALIAQEHSNQGISIQAYLVVVVFRDLVLAWLMAMVVREVLNPRRDVVRHDGVDDPAGGVLVAPLGNMEG
ncbi:MAG TPA: glycosyltransferase 87 family protein [Mycobacteriales bacterium]|nr:glycosyltransferase 87 family protein [Mycobacteriales bacterium]